MKRSLAILLAHLAIMTSASAAGGTWNTERSHFPPAWAKQLSYSGELHLQFAPGFQKTNSTQFWSYVILYKLEGNVLANRLELEQTLKAYDVGLYAGAVPASQVGVSLEDVKAVPTQGHDTTRWTGHLKGFDSFFTQRPLDSHLEVARWFCPASERTFVLILRSPAVTTDAVWPELRTKGAAQLCHPNDAKPLRASLTGRIQAVDDNLSKAGLKTTVHERMRQANVPGMSVAVLSDGRIDWCKAYGIADLETGALVTTNTLFQAASISKSIAAVAVMRLVEAGKLSLDRDVNEALRSWRVPASQLTADSPVTIRQILSHTAGFNRSSVEPYLPGEPLPSALDALLARKPAKNEPLKMEARPGSRWNYSGGGFTVLQQLLNDLQESDFATTARREVFVPLGLNHSTFEKLLPGATPLLLASGHRTNAPLAGKWRMHPEQAAAGLWTTASDLALMLAELGRAYAGKNQTFLRQNSVRELWSAQWKNSALGFFLNGSGKYRRVNHDGANSGYICQMVFYPELGHGAVVMTNADEGNDLVQEVLASIAEEYRWPEYAP